MTVDAALVENNSVLLFYTLTDKEQNIFKNKIGINECSLKIEDSVNFGRTIANHNVNGKLNCIVFNFNSPELLNKKDLDLEFSINSLRQAEDTKEYSIPLKDGGENKAEENFEKGKGFELISCKMTLPQ